MTNCICNGCYSAVSLLPPDQPAAAAVSTAADNPALLRQLIDETQSQVVFVVACNIQRKLLVCCFAGALC